MINRRHRLLHLHCHVQQGTFKNPHIYHKEWGTKLPVLWCGLCLLYCHGWGGGGGGLLGDSLVPGRSRLGQI